MGLGRAAWREARETLQKILAAEEPTLRDNTELRSRYEHIFSAQHSSYITNYIAQICTMQNYIAQIRIVQNYFTPISIVQNHIAQISIVQNFYLQYLIPTI